MSIHTKQITDIRDAVFDTLLEIARHDKNIVLLAADMGAMSICQFQKELPGQYINVGIAEQNMISVAAGLALCGKKVFVYAIAPFATERCYEQIKVDLSVMKLPVVIIGAGPGITYAPDGPTHHALEDVAAMRALPNMHIYNPCDGNSSKNSVYYAYSLETPAYIRVDKGLYENLHVLLAPDNGILEVKKGTGIAIFSTGCMTQEAINYANNLSEKYALDAAIYDIYRIKPLNREMFLDIADKYEYFVTLEENFLNGGMGSAIAEVFSDFGILKPLKRFGIDDEYARHYSDRTWLHKYFHIDMDTVCQGIYDWVAHWKSRGR